jgi:hypothetical protein
VLVAKWRFPVGTEEKGENTAGNDTIKSEKSVLTFQKDLLPPISVNLAEDSKLHTSCREYPNCTIFADSQFGPNVNQTCRPWAHPLYMKQRIKTGEIKRAKIKKKLK